MFTSASPMAVPALAPVILHSMWRLSQVLFIILQPLRMPGLIARKITHHQPGNKLQQEVMTGLLSFEL